MMTINITDNLIAQLVEYINETRDTNYSEKDIMDITVGITNIEVRFKSEYIVRAVNTSFIYTWWNNKLIEAMYNHK